MVENLTKEELSNELLDLEGKYQKLLKLAKKLAKEMDSLHDRYVEVKTELEKR